jgi:hypothetical protein
MSFIKRARRATVSKAGVAFVAALALGTTSAAVWAATTATASTPDSIWGSSAPSFAAVDSDTGSVELGTKFTAVSAGQATGVRFYKTPENRGNHTGSLWTSTGTLIGTVTFGTETSSGWQTATFAKPVTLSAGTSYVVSYHMSYGRYLATERYTGASTSANLRVPSSNIGVYAYGTTSSFPTETWHASNYWVDLTFAKGATGSTSTPAPGPSSTATDPATTLTPSASRTATPSVTSTASPSASATSSVPTVSPLSITPTASAVTTKASTTSPTTGASSGSSSYPGATNTGVPAGTALKASGGTLTLSTNGQVVSGLDITGNVVITASNVTLQRSRITDASWNIIQISESATNVTIQDVEINGKGSLAGANGIYGPATVLRSNIYGVENGIVPLSNSVIRDNYIHGLMAPGSPHYDGIQIDGGQSNVKITHNYIDMHEWTQTSTVMIDNYFGPISNIAVDNNLLIGAGYSVYSDNQFTSSVISGVSFTNNRIGKGYWGFVSINGPKPVWTGNVDATTGAAISQT